MRMKYLALAATLIFCTLTGSFLRPAATARNTATGDWFFVVVETQVHMKNVEIDDEHPEERRWYISNVTVLPDSIADSRRRRR